VIFLSRLFVLSVGFEEKFAVRTLTRHGLDIGDKLVLVTGPRVEKVDRTISFIQDFIEKYYGRGIELKVFELDFKEGFIYPVTRLVEFLMNWGSKYSSIIVNLSGGMRAVVLTLALTSMLVSCKIKGKLLVELETEDSATLLKFEEGLLGLPVILSELEIRGTKALSEILNVLRSRALTVVALAQLLEKDPSTIRRHLLRLERLGIVQATPLRPRSYTITPLGRLLLTLLEP